MRRKNYDDYRHTGVSPDDFFAQQRREILDHQLSDCYYASYVGINEEENIDQLNPQLQNIVLDLAEGYYDASGGNYPGDPNIYDYIRRATAHNLNAVLRLAFMFNEMTKRIESLEREIKQYYDDDE